jgi:hypothetical protein
MEGWIMGDIRTSSLGGIPFGNNAGRPAETTGQPYFNGEAQRLELYTATGWNNIIQEVPGVSSIGGSYLESQSSNNIIIYGTNFISGATAYAVGTNNAEIAATSTIFNSLVQLTASFTGLTAAYEPYDIKVINPSNLFGILPDALYVNNILTWQTAAGSLGTFQDNVAMSVSATALDDSTITYSLSSGSSLPSGITLNSSTGLISGNIGDILQNVTYTFTINASDGSNPVVPRTFSMTFNAAPIWSTNSGSLGTFNHETTINIALSASDVSDSITFALASGQSLPSGISLNSSTGVISGTLPTVASDTTYSFIVNVTDGVNTIGRSFSFISKYAIIVEALVVAGGGAGSGFGGGGGGAGGLVYSSSYGLNSGSFTVAVGAGGASNGNTTGNNGANSQLSTLVALGGGTSGWDGLSAGVAGGSGGGGGTYSGPPNPGGAGLQPSSASGGFGNAGGTAADMTYGAGGGGAGAAGQAGASGGAGGDGKQYSITGTATYYAGGGGGGARSSGSRGQTAGGLGGGGTGSSSSSNNGTAGTSNTGGGGGGSQGYNAGTSASGNAGGSGVVIIAYPATKPALTISGGLTYDQPTRSGYRVYRFTAGSGTITL